MNEEKTTQEARPVPYGMVRFDTFCQFCGKQNGYVEVPEASVPEDRDVTADDLKIADVRCSECEADKGTYKEMEMEFYREVGGSYEDFKVMHELAEGDVKKFSPMAKAKREEIEREREQRILAERAASEAALAEDAQKKSEKL